MWNFPLKDANGVIQGIQKVINDHFIKVFAQNSVPDGDIWREYWEQVDNLFDKIDEMTIHEYSKSNEPTEGEIYKILSEMNPKKGCYGLMTIDLVKLGGDKLFKVIHKCIVMCIRNNVLPDNLERKR